MIGGNSSNCVDTTNKQSMFLIIYHSVVYFGPKTKTKKYVSILCMPNSFAMFVHANEYIIRFHSNPFRWICHCVRQADNGMITLYTVRALRWVRSELNALNRRRFAHRKRILKNYMCFMVDFRTHSKNTERENRFPEKNRNELSGENCAHRSHRLELEHLWCRVQTTIFSSRNYNSCQNSSEGSKRSGNACAGWKLPQKQSKHNSIERRNSPRTNYIIE